MLLRSVDVLKGGEILAMPVLSNKSDILIPKGVAIKTEYIPLIASLGIQDVMIEDTDDDHETSYTIIEKSHYDDYVKRIKRIMESHIYQSNGSLREFEMIADQIVKEIQLVEDEMTFILKERQTNLYEHTIMVTLLCVLIGKRLHLDKDRLYSIAVGALMHDIGIRYITVSYENIDIDSLEPAAIFELKKHTILGYSALEGESWIPAISRKMILCHHERKDGTGYPMRQKNKEIECGIIQVCDAFDGYISGMECRRKSVQDTLALFRECAGITYQKKVVDKLLKTIQAKNVNI